MEAATTANNLMARIAAHFRTRGKPEPTIRGGQTPRGFTVGIKVQGDDGYTLFYGNTAQEVLDQIEEAY